MSTYDSFSGTLKLDFYILPQLRLTYQLFGSYSESFGSGSYYRYQPDSKSTSRSWSYHNFLTLRHAPTDNFFYNLSASYQFNDGESFYRKDNKVAMYPGDEGIQLISSSADGFSLGDTPGFYTDAEGKNFRELILLNGDFNWQIDRYNFLKAGFIFKKHRVNTYSYGYTLTQDWVNKQFPDDGTLDPNAYSFGEYWDSLNAYWQNWEEINDTVRYRKYTDDEYYNWRDYTIEPIEFAAYLQDKLEFGEIIVNAGVRFDAFLPNEKVPSNYRVEALELGAEANLIDAEDKFQFSPRLGISFPISATGAFHAAYGHFFQMPSFEKMFNEPLYVLRPIQLEGRTLGNADLLPEKTIAYEIGLQQEIIPGLAFDITAYYKDIKNLLGIEILQTIDAVEYYRYINRDYGNTKGITFGIRKGGNDLITGAINYTFSYANGSSSSPEALSTIRASTQIGGEPIQFVDRKILSLDWDQRHTLNVILNVGVPGDWSVGMVSYLNSGLPYSPSFNERYDIPEREYKNSAEKPLRWGVDLKAQKSFEFGGMRYNLFLKVDNVFDQLNEEDVYSSSGTADYQVRLPENETLELERLAQQNLFTLEEIDSRPQWYSSPRKIQLGIEVRF